MIAGVGPGVGEAVARRLAAADRGVGLLARSPDSDFAGAVGADRPTATSSCSTATPASPSSDSSRLEGERASPSLP